jgi:hypothetical protein
MKNTITIIGLLLLALSTSLSMAGNGPKPNPVEPGNLKNVITVSETNADFTNPAVALASITDANESNPYLVQVGPGVYTLDPGQQLLMQPWITIQGSGQDTTMIRGQVSSGYADGTSALVIGADNSAISDLGISNADVGVAIGMHMYEVSPRVERLTIHASGSSEAYGIYSHAPYTSISKPTMSNVSVVSESSSWAAGIYNYYSWPEIYNVDAQASAPYAKGIVNVVASPRMVNVQATATGTSYSIGVHNDSSANPVMIDVSATASGPGSNTGVFNREVSAPTMIGVIAKATGGASDNIGVHNEDTSHAVMTNVTAIGEGGTNGIGLYNVNLDFTGRVQFTQDSRLIGSTYGLRITSNSSNTRVVNSEVVGGVDDQAPDTTQCRGNYDQDLADVGC